MRLAVKSTANFVTHPLKVTASAEALSYQILPERLDFQAMQARRRPLHINNPYVFSCESANLGVSTHLTLTLAGQHFEVLVRMGHTNTLKLISGYVPALHLAEPWPMLLEEVSEEYLLHTPTGWLGGRVGRQALPRPYQDTLPYSNDQPFALALEPNAPCVFHGTQALYGAPNAYLHTPTASLQLVYRLHLSLPKGIEVLRLEHVDERYENGQLLVERSAEPNLYLRPLDGPRDRLFQYADGQLQPVSTQGLYLSEAFAAQRGWLIEAPCISWQQAFGQTLL